MYLIAHLTSGCIISESMVGILNTKLINVDILEQLVHHSILHASRVFVII